MLLNKGLVAFYKELEVEHTQDSLFYLRDRYYLPQESGKMKIYLAGNSLGLQPKTVEFYLNEELKIWREFGVDGHFKGEVNWFNYHAQFDKTISKLLQVHEDEVVVSNALTVNIHLLFANFYKPNAKRNKILIESPCFSSDYHAICSQIEWHGLDVKETLIEAKPRENEFTLRKEDLLNLIDKHRDELALVWIGAVNYYTGQFFDINSISRKAHEVGAMIGLDLAHAIGNVPLYLHDQNIDFATWCSYKYLNSGPGGVSGFFIHRKHHHLSPSFKGWWGVDEKERFKMDKAFIPMKGAKAWQLSNAPIMNMAAHKAALKEFESVDFRMLRSKSVLLSNFLIQGIQLLIETFPNCGLKIITPFSEEERGCQVSVLTSETGKSLFEYLLLNGVVADWREPNVIRMAPVPMYNTFLDVSETIKLMFEFYRRLHF